VSQIGVVKGVHARVHGQTGLVRCCSAPAYLPPPSSGEVRMACQGGLCAQVKNHLLDGLRGGARAEWRADARGTSGGAPKEHSQGTGASSC
jgi:hypothetical protein